METIKKVRITNDAVRAKIQNYIFDCVDTEDFESHTGDMQTSLEIIWKEFQRVALYANNLRNLKSYEACFIDWLQGLPGCLNIDYMTYRQLELMAQFGLPLPEGKDEMDGVNLFYKLIYREFCRVSELNGVKISQYYNTIG